MAVIGDRVATPEAGWLRIDERDPKIVYTGTWTDDNTTTVGTYLNTDKWTSQSGATIKFSFYGTKLRIFGTRNTDRPTNIGISIDGVAESYSLYGSLQRQTLAYEKTGLSSGRHDVLITVPTLTSQYVDIDAIDIDSDGSLMATIGSVLTTPESSWQRLDDRNPKIVYVGTWTQGPATGMYASTETYGNTVGSLISFRFYGTKVRLIANMSSPGTQNVPVFVDGVAESYTINKPGLTSTQYQCVVYEKQGLPLGIHDVTIKVPDTGGYIGLDAVDIDDTGYMITIMGSQLLNADPGWRRYDDADPKIVYDAYWGTYNAGSGNSTYWNNICHYSGANGAVAKFRFYGTKVRLISPLYAAGDKLLVSIDGSPQEIANENNAVTKIIALVYEKTGLTLGYHTVVITSSITTPGTSQVALDAIDIDDTGYLTVLMGTALTTPDTGWKRYDCTSGAFQYNPVGSNVWSFSTAPNRWAANAGTKQTIKFNFTGTKLRLLGYNGADRSMDITIQIDGGAPATFSQYNANVGVSYALNYEVTGLSAGIHTATITVGNSFSTGIVFQAVDVDSAASITHLQEATSLSRMQIGDRIRANYVAASGSTPGSFSNLGQDTGNPVLPYNPTTTTVLSEFYFIMAGFDYKGNKVLVADRNVQSLSWTSINDKGYATKDGAPVSALSTSDYNGYVRLFNGDSGTGDIDGEWYRYLGGNTLGGSAVAGDNGIWHWAGTTSWVSSATGATRATKGNSGANDTSSIAVSSLAGFRPVLTLQPAYANKYLVQDDNDIKYFSTSGSPQWITVGQSPVTESMFQSSGMSDLSIIDAAAIALLTSNQPKLLAYAGFQPSTVVRGVPSMAKVILASGDINMNAYMAITNVTVSGFTAGTGAIAVVFSTDKGKTWKTWNGTAAVPVDTTDLTAVKAQGMSLATLGSLTAANWAAILGQYPATLRFGYYLEQSSYTDFYATDKMTITVNMMGEWGNAITGTDFMYTYLDNESLQVKIQSNGDFKVNY